MLLKIYCDKMNKTLNKLINILKAIWHYHLDIGYQLIQISFIYYFYFSISIGFKEGVHYPLIKKLLYLVKIN